MKRSLILLYSIISLVCLTASGAHVRAQETNNSEKILIDAKDLPADVLLKIQTKQKLEQYGEHAKWGHEIGVAVNETLSSVTSNTAAFAETKVGKLAMFLVAWKIMAKDLMETSNKMVGYAIGVPVWFFGSITIIWSYRRLCVPKRYLQQVCPDKTKRYEMHLGIENPRDLGPWAASHGLAFIVLSIICALIIFS
jgi:hypothetical protein